MRRCAILIGLLLAALSHASAEQGRAIEPIVRATLDPPRVVVGQKTTLQIEVLAPNYMTAPPELPSFQVRNAVTRELASVNTNEQQDDTSYAGVRFEYAIYPQEPGSYAVTDQKVRVRYAAEPPATREVTLALPRVSFEAFIPAAAGDLRPFVAANTLTIEQAIQRSSDELKAGDAVTRTVTTKAEGTPAMLLPPQKLTAIEGLASYPGQPTLEDKTEGRTDTMTSTRVDSVTYMLEKPGDYTLPAIDLRWWNVRDEKLELAHLDAVTLRVVANPAVDVTAPVGQAGAGWTWDALVDFIAGHWLPMIVAASVLAGLAWIAPGWVRRMAASYRHRLQAYRASEAWSFRQLRKALRQGNTHAIYFALLDWLLRFKSIAPVATIDSLKEAAQDPVLDRQIDSLQSELFAPKPGAVDLSPRKLLRHIRLARRSLRRQSTSGKAEQALPQELNPIRRREPPLFYRRVPAR